MGKNDRKTIVNNIKELNLEIDYDKLAKAIIDAEKSAIEKERFKSYPKMNFLETILKIITNKEPKTGKQTSYFLSYIISWLFNMMAIGGIVVSTLLLKLFFTTFRWFSNFFQNALAVLLLFIFIFLILIVCLIFRGIANELKEEKDRNYIISVFSGIVSFAALIVALVALFKGVG